MNLLQRKKCFRVKVNLRPIPLNINIVYPEPNNQTTFRQLHLKAMSMVSPSHCLLVKESEAVREHFNLDIKTM